MTEFAKHLAVFGTASDVGKSLLCTAFCRLLAREGRRVAPFKAQNMSNNAFVTADGGEMGRAQYLQAVAAGVVPSVLHNPVLLKPSADNSSQVIVHGKVAGNTDARAYFNGTSPLREAAFQSLHELMRTHETLVIEGAGSCAEVNLRSREFVNFPAAHVAKANVVLVADIDRGGVFAQVVGSLEVMPAADRARVRGVVINKFRGDRSLFDDGVSYLEQRTGLPVLGVIPFLYGLDLDAEDGLTIEHRVDPVDADVPGLRIAVLKLPHIANFTDFDALAREPGVIVDYLYRPRPLLDYAGVILPGTKSVLADRQWLRATGWDQQLLAYHRAGGRMFGMCGGFQLLGEQICDPAAVESQLRADTGLGLLRVSTVFRAAKTVRQVTGRVAREHLAIRGYEIHLGQTQADGYEPLLWLDGATPGHSGSLPMPQSDGVRDDDGRVWASYVHGLFDSSEFRALFLRWLDPRFEPSGIQLNSQARLNAEIDRFADMVATHIDWGQLRGWLQNATEVTTI